MLPFYNRDRIHNKHFVLQLCKPIPANALFIFLWEMFQPGADNFSSSSSRPTAITGRSKTKSRGHASRVWLSERRRSRLKCPKDVLVSQVSLHFCVMRVRGHRV